MYIDKDGAPVLVEGAVDTSDKTIEKLKDLIILQLDRQGLSLRDIGRVLRLHNSTVHKRLKAIPPEAKEYYRESMGRLG